MKIQDVDVVKDQTLLLIIETASSANPVVGLGTPRTSVGTFMDASKTYLHVHSNDVGLVVVEEVAGLVILDFKLIS